MSDDLTRDRENQDGEVQGAQGSGDAESGMMASIPPGQQPISLDELKAYQEQEGAQPLDEGVPTEPEPVPEGEGPL